MVRQGRAAGKRGAAQLHARGRQRHGVVARRPNGYIGPVEAIRQLLSNNRAWAARVAAVGHGGQIVVSGPTEALVSSSLPSGITLRDLGRHALKDLPVAEHLFQVDVPGLRTDFPPLRVVGDIRGNLPNRLRRATVG